MKTFVIASKEEFAQSQGRLQAIGVRNAERVDPVYTEDRCIRTRGETGCFRAHKNAWSKCAQQSASRCLILERDWTYGNQDPAHVKSELHAIDTSADLYQIGTGGMHAYTLSKQQAAKLSTVHECDVGLPVDLWLWQQCDDGDMTCDEYVKDNMPDCYGGGLLQQNRRDMRGMHNKDNKMDKQYL